MCSVDFSDAELVDAPLAEAIGRNSAVTGYVGAIHVYLLFTLLYSALASTVPRRPSASPSVGMLMSHCWR